MTPDGVGPRVVRAVLGLLVLVLALATVVAPVRPAAAAGDPGPGDDFPRMPRRCYEDDGVRLRDEPCRVVTLPGRRPTLLVWGDSHGWMYLPALRHLARQERVDLVMAIAGGCPPSLVATGERPRGRCEKHNAHTLALVRRLQQRRAPFQVLVAGFWSGYRQAYGRVRRERAGGPDSGLTDYEERRAELAVDGGPRLFRILGRLRVDTDAVGQAATVPLHPAPCAAGREPYQCDLPRVRAMHRERDNRRWLEQQVARLSGRPRVVDATPAYCSALVCRAHAFGTDTFYDDIHLAAGLTRHLTRYFAPTFDDLVRAAG